MRSLPQPGEPTLLRPLPGRQVPLEGAKGRFLPPSGAVFPWSAHWQYFVRCGALEQSRACPAWDAEVFLRPVADKKPCGPAKEGEKSGKALAAAGELVRWAPHWKDLLLAGEVEFPRVLPAAGELVRVKPRGPVKDGEKAPAWKNAKWSEDLQKQLLAGQLEFPEVPLPDEKEQK